MKRENRTEHGVVCVLIVAKGYTFKYGGTLINVYAGAIATIKGIISVVRNATQAYGALQMCYTPTQNQKNHTQAHLLMSLLPFYKKLSKSSIRQLLACCCANRPWSPQTFGNTLFCRTGTWKGQRPFCRKSTSARLRDIRLHST